jgi:hypothetical protein
MADAINVNASKIDAKILSILSEYSGKKLLSATAGLTMQSLLIIHPAPQSIIRAIVSQRCMEDLILLFCLKGAALATVHAEFPKIDMNEWVKKSTLIDFTMWQETPTFKEFVNYMQENKENVKRNNESTIRLVNDFVEEHDNERFDLEQYISSHRDLLSYNTDCYMIMMVVSYEGGKHLGSRELEDPMWIMREELALAREKYKITH